MSSAVFWMRTRLCFSELNVLLGGKREATGTFEQHSLSWLSRWVEPFACCHVLLTTDYAIDNCYLGLLPWFLSLRFCFMSPSWEFTFLMKSFRCSFISWDHPFHLIPPLSSLGKKENTTQKKLSPLNFHHLDNLWWQGSVAGGHCFLPG